MSEYITGFRTSQGVKKIDYNSLANLPEISAGGGFIASETPPEDTEVLWVDTSDDSRTEVSCVSTSISQISLTTEWTGDESPYTQIVTLDNYVITNNSKIDLQPDARTIMQLIEDGVNAMNVENNDGVVTVYVVGEKPSTEMTIQCTIEEVR